MKCDVAALQVTVEESGRFAHFGSQFYLFDVHIEA